ncbi:universal stress protein [Aliiglaciecola litoralis]|uniref:Universal stress protein n=1 Tax=Aliiglaciecola litoralis TaxID=582857 RepID=A0ABP3X4Z4_9ALTE
MQNYKNILVALDIYRTYESVVERALKLAKKPADLSLLYVAMPHVYFEPYGAAFDANVVEDLHAQSLQKLNAIASQYKIPATHVHCVVGHPADEIHNKAETLKADLIVLGTHGHSGLKLLLGSTANAVLHGVQRDVLAVKV